MPGDPAETDDPAKRGPRGEPSDQDGRRPSRPGPPDRGAVEECGADLPAKTRPKGHVWHVPIKPGERTYCSRCGALRRRSPKRKRASTPGRAGGAVAADDLPPSVRAKLPADV